MGLTGWLARVAARGPRPLVVTAPFGTGARLLVEAETARRGWLPALSPAAASVLVVCGSPGAELAELVRQAWAAVPRPRALVRLPEPVGAAEVGESLDGAVAALGEARHDDHDETPPPQDRRERGPDDPGSHEHGSRRHGSHGHGGREPGDHQHGSCEPGGHQHGGREPGEHARHMGGPGGLAMATRGDDRDGLRLDRLHVPLGPILPDWPAGLIVHTVMQGDVIQEAGVEILPGGGRSAVPYWIEPWTSGAVTRRTGGRRRAAARLDGLGRLLGVAGWPAAAAQARRLRDDLLDGGGDGDGGDGVAAARGFDRLDRRVRRSRILRWMLRDVGLVDGTDVLGRMERMLDDIGVALDERVPMDGPPPPGPALDLLPGLLEGAELAQARLIVASLDPDVERVLHA
ncbi:hypothetical protein ACFSKW_22850 [Nonomuraea mangrovi]|uniref:Uncharacterized protein n=1 Tax=Nonomuraea mangrovi TaxID=2316207 RepID=A0ABW4SYC1_9ACTN